MFNKKSYLSPVNVEYKADTVASPRIVYGEPATAIYLLLSDEMSWARVTIEGFDSIRICRGELAPYKYLNEQSYGYWVYEVEESDWLKERNDYEVKNYETELLEEYYHYLFSFHDEYVELIAKGIWIEPVSTVPSSELDEKHPMLHLPESLPSIKQIYQGIEYEIRENPKSSADLLKDSKLCSQKLFQYYLTLDGQTSPSYAALFRTGRNGQETKMEGGLFYKQRGNVAGMATIENFQPAWEKYLLGIVERRRELGKSV